MDHEDSRHAANRQHIHAINEPARLLRQSAGKIGLVLSVLPQGAREPIHGTFAGYSKDGNDVLIKDLAGKVIPCSLEGIAINPFKSEDLPN